MPWGLPGEGIGYMIGVWCRGAYLEYVWDIWKVHSVKENIMTPDLRVKYELTKQLPFT